MQNPPGSPADQRSLYQRLKDRVPSRRECFEAGGLAVVAGLVGSLSPQTHPPAHAADLAPLVPRLNDLRDRLHEKARGWVMNRVESIARPGKSAADSFIYIVDLGQLMEHFARAGDAEPYLKLRQFAIDHVVIDKADDPYTKGFVLWRCVPNTKPDCSGTTEALRVARALWAGGKAFNRPQDRVLALTIIEGYGRHYTIDQDIWLIRNYFSFGSRSFANNTFVIDYDADFLRQVAGEIKASDPDGHQRIADLADKSYGLMRRTPTPCGLLYDLVQPELKTMYWGIDVSAFSPNDIVQTNNACTTASTIAKGESGLARKVLAFFKNKLAESGTVHSHYYGRTGERVLRRDTRAVENMSVARLAALLDDKPAVVQFANIGLKHWEKAVNSASPDKAWAASEVLLGLHEVLAVAG